ncbi:hypothetical protein MKK75_32325 [Methylobacterium sp. J-030]|uniref:hypothetical protein n=1 Tax=Methylobacterium sp. J-030 TaxID=2836627 RepID=UPI001FB9E968|nr:hypothetical protein [Methylobacterium sp. J-030]MCJ2073418.1 hypothetical protein [Methylobacterium sp. J-030]
MLQDLLTGDVGVADVESRAQLVARALAGAGFRPITRHKIVCVRDGRVMWEEEGENLTTYAGLAHMLTNYWKGNAYTAGFFVGLKGSGTIAGGDTSASHAGWSEVQAYAAGTRPALTLGAVTTGATSSVDNSAAPASFSINAANTAVSGAFVATSSAKGSTTDTIIGASDFAASRTLQSGDTLNTTITLTAVTG